MLCQQSEFIKNLKMIPFCSLRPNVRICRSSKLLVSSKLQRFVSAAAPSVVFCCFNIDMLCFQRPSHAYLSFKEWLSELLLPSHWLRAGWLFSSGINKHVHSENCCSLDICSFLDHSLQIVEKIVQENSSSLWNTQIINKREVDREQNPVEHRF